MWWFQSAVVQSRVWRGLLIGLLFSIGGLSGCHYIVAHQPQANYDPIVIRVSGYGALEKEEQAKSPRYRLLAMRASKLDAYRALVERIYGTVIYGTSTVNSLVLEHDEFRGIVDSVIRGARVLSVSGMKEGGYETVLEVVLSSRFRACLTNVNYFRYTEECRMPLPHADPQIHASMDSPPTETSGLYFLGKSSRDDEPEF